MTKFDEAQSASRRRAEEVLTRKKAQDAERLSTSEKERRVFDEKTARLRNLRLAKEVADKATKESDAATRKRDAAAARRRHEPASPAATARED